jgi:hypothetical protein
MTDTTELTSATQIINELANQVKQTAVTYGPDAYNLALQYVQLAVYNTIVSFVWILISFVFYTLANIFIKKIIKIEKRPDAREWTGPSIIMTVVSFFLIIFGTFMLFCSLENILDPTNMMGLFAPKLSLVQHVINAVSAKN